jgi:hypothetical protein
LLADRPALLALPYPATFHVSGIPETWKSLRRVE